MKDAKLFFILLCLAALIAPAAAAGGAGTAANPYIIETAAELQSIQNNLAAYYVLGNDIDLQGYSFTPIGSQSSPFSGQLDGNGYTISNLDLSSTIQGAALFSGLTSGATIKNLKLIDCNVDSTNSRTGCLIGSIIMSANAHETATLQNIEMVRCIASSSSYHVGVLCGLIGASSVVDIIDCELVYCDAESTSGFYVGVLYGRCSSGGTVNMNNCIVAYSHAKAGDTTVGLLCGFVCSSLTMTNCVVENSIAESTGSTSVGVLCGSCGGVGSLTMTNCSAKNSIAKGINYIGGCIGSIIDSGSSITATGCTVTGCTILATGNYAGGIAGRTSSGTTGVFSSNTVTGCTILATSYAATICPAFS